MLIGGEERRILLGVYARIAGGKGRLALDESPEHGAQKRTVGAA